VYAYVCANRFRQHAEAKKLSTSGKTKLTGTFVRALVCVCACVCVCLCVCASVCVQTARQS